MKEKTAALCVISAGVLWGVISFFIRALSAAGLDSLQITAVRMLVTAPIFFAVAARRGGKSLKIRLRDIWMFIGTGIISIVLFNACYFYTMIHSQVSIAVVLLYTSPVFVMLLSALLLGEKITPKKLLALAAAIAGCVLTAGLSLSGGGRLSPLILLTGLCSGLFYGLYTIFGQAALKKYDTLTVSAYTFLFGLLGAMPICRPQEILPKILSHPTVILWCVGIGIICTVLPYFLYTYGLRVIDGSRAAILACVEPLVGAVIGMTFWRESRDIFKICGIALILAAIMLLGKNESKKEKAAVQDK